MKYVCRYSKARERRLAQSRPAADTSAVIDEVCMQSVGIFDEYGHSLVVDVTDGACCCVGGTNLSPNLELRREWTDR